MTNSYQQINIHRPGILSKYATAITTIYSLGGIILASIQLFTNDSYFGLLSGIFYPLLGLLIIAISNGSIRFFSDQKNWFKSGSIVGFSLPTLVLLFDAFRYFLISDYSAAWLPCGIILIITFLILFLTSLNRDKSDIFAKALLLLIIIAAYSFGTTIVVNCKFDNSPPMKFNTSVERKYTTSNRNDENYHLVLMSWERHQAPIDIAVSRTEYEQTPVDGPVGGHIKRGLLGIKWFYLDM